MNALYILYDISRENVTQFFNFFSKKFRCVVSMNALYILYDISRENVTHKTKKFFIEMRSR
jgi:hypothetical protein